MIKTHFKDPIDGVGEFPVITVNRGEIAHAFGHRYAQSFLDKVKKKANEMTDDEMTEFAHWLKEEYVDQMFFESIRKIFIRHFM